MENDLTERLEYCQKLSERILENIEILNALLSEAAKQDMYILINKEEIDVGSKILQNKFTLRVSSRTVKFY